MMNLDVLAKEIHENAVAHGWWDEERTIDEIVSLIHSELSEALEEYRNEKPMVYIVDGKPEGIAVELADAVIRILDYCGRHELEVQFWLERKREQEPDVESIFTTLLAGLHWAVSVAYTAVQMTHNDDIATTYFADVINEIEKWLKTQGIDLWDVVRQKHEYNKTRSYRHGGKKV